MCILHRFLSFYIYIHVEFTQITITSITLLPGVFPPKQTPADTQPFESTLLLMLQLLHEKVLYVLFFLKSRRYCRAQHFPAHCRRRFLCAPITASGSYCRRSRRHRLRFCVSGTPFVSGGIGRMFNYTGSAGVYRRRG